MIYSKFTDNQEDNEESTTLVSSAAQTSPSTTTQSVINNETSITTFSTIPSTKPIYYEVPTTVYTPYINRAHLKSLDTSSLERNMQIRHDLMIEEGYRASLPRLFISDEDEALYWESIRAEVTGLQNANANDAPRLRALLTEIREMMIDLYPRCDVVIGEFAEFLEDSQFIIQQLKIGAIDIQRFFKFLGSVMKKNCAPKRDVLVDAMVSCDYPIEGLKCALKLIELMKLDLANFKLDQLRPIIAKTAVSTERAFFSQLFSSGKISLELTIKWLSQHKNSSSCYYETFLDAGIRLLVSPFVKDTCHVPETFVLDKKRLISLHGRFQDLCIVQCLLLIFKQASSKTGVPNRKIFSACLLKVELLRLLEQPDTKISDISNLLIQCLKDSQTDSINFDYIHSALNNIISPDNQLFLLIEEKMLKRIKLKLNESCEKEKKLSGFSDLNVLEEFDELIRKFAILLQYNWTVFEPIYQNLLNKQ
jgi:hypothetical protein